jgi:hypothetical protein
MAAPNACQQQRCALRASGVRVGRNFALFSALSTASMSRSADFVSPGNKMAATAVKMINKLSESGSSIG